jgi:hypothetical protein
MSNEDKPADKASEISQDVPETDAKAFRAAPKRKKETDTDDDVATNNPRHAKPGIGWDRWIELFFTAAIVGATVVNVYVANRQWTTMLESNTINRESFNAVQRPFVFAKGVSIGQNMPGYWEFAVRAENSGSTPTRDLEYLTISDGASPTDPEDVFVQTPKNGYDAPDRLIQRWPGTFIGPKAETTLLGSFFGLPITHVTEMAEKRQNYYVRGVIHYRDAFAGTPEHVTKFCYAVIPYKNGTETRVNTDRCLYWNCADEDCKADRERYDHDLKVINSQPGKK